MTMRHLIQRLERIQAETGEKPKDGGATGPEDEFTRLRKSVHVQIKAARRDLKSRNELLEKKGSSDARSAELSAAVRKSLREAKQDIEKMKLLNEKACKKRSAKKEEVKEELAHREEVVDLALKVWPSECVRWCE